MREKRGSENKNACKKKDFDFLKYFETQECWTFATTTLTTLYNFYDAITITTIHIGALLFSFHYNSLRRLVG